MSSKLRDDAVVARLAASRDGGVTGFLAPHHLAAAERLERLIRRAQLLPRVTMSYNPASVGGQGGNSVEAGSDSAASARQKLNALAATVPVDCWGVLIDVCGLGKGLQLVETERRWPRRSAKLVLRIGLDHLAAHFGLSAQAVGDVRGSQRNWLEHRLPLVTPEPP